MADDQLRKAKRILQQEVARSDDDEFRYQLRTALQHIVIHEDEQVSGSSRADGPSRSGSVEDLSNAGANTSS